MNESRRGRKIQLHWKNYKNKRKWVAGAVHDYMCDPTWIWFASEVCALSEMGDLTRRQRQLFARAEKWNRRKAAVRKAEGKKGYLELEAEYERRHPEY